MHASHTTTLSSSEGRRLQHACILAQDVNTQVLKTCMHACMHGWLTKCGSNNCSADTCMHGCCSKCSNYREAYVSARDDAEAPSDAHCREEVLEQPVRKQQRPKWTERKEQQRDDDGAQSSRTGGTTAQSVSSAATGGSVRKQMGQRSSGLSAGINDNLRTFFAPAISSSFSAS